MVDIIGMRNCKRCKGTGTDDTWKGPQPCKHCGGTGQVTQPDLNAIFQAVTKTSKGKLSFRKSKPTKNEFSDLFEARVYYVWRMTRFHGGLDVTMPIMAGLTTAWDPYTPELDRLVDVMAKMFCGTNMAAAARWGRALGHEVPQLPGLPPSAQEGGPVILDDNKPISEALEKQ